MFGVGMVLLLLVLLGMGAVVLSRAPFLRITTVMVEGAETLAAERVAEFVEKEFAGRYWGLFAKNNIFLYPKGSLIAALLAEYPVLRSAQLRAADFHTVSVSVVERHPRAIWCGSVCYLMDEDAVTYAPAPVFSEPVYIVYRGERLSAEEFRALSTLVDAVSKLQAQDKVEIVAVDAERDVRVGFASGFELLFALSEAGGDVFERFSLVLVAEPFQHRTLADFEYLDLRWGYKLYYKVRE